MLIYAVKKAFEELEEVSRETDTGDKNQQTTPLLIYNRRKKTNRAVNEVTTVSGETDSGDDQIKKTNREANEPVTVSGETDTSFHTSLEHPMTAEGVSNP
ncbi:unnamed protein product [Eruca vesicaria subsp. sativa]|uniref:Uncharacterized protein n=1 Tax=Eruca vesicaria subsp. sativa TaxID=29727 RepID=A0ABC8LG92_ERUVS|nr:unnamed protein product [Eruca vesicaria subsp. sativa]